MQDDRQSEDLPFGSRGGIAIRKDFPVDGEYLITVKLQRQYQALGAAPATAAKPADRSLERKLLRQLEAPTANAAVRY